MSEWTHKERELKLWTCLLGTFGKYVGLEVKSTDGVYFSLCGDGEMDGAMMNLEDEPGKRFMSLIYIY